MCIRDSLRILAPWGTAGSGDPHGGVICDFATDQTVQSAPAVGSFLAGGATGIAVGTGTTYAGASTTNDVIVLDTHCNVKWADKLDGETWSSPALADTSGNGTLNVVQGTWNGSSGAVWVLNGANGSPIWHAAAAGSVVGSIVTADLGGGYQDLIVPTSAGVQIFDGRSGALITTLQSSDGFQNAPLVTQDANGTVGITIAGFDWTDTGVIYHYELAGSNNSKVYGVGAWPQFHHDPQLTGNAGSHVVEFIANGANGRVWNGYDQSTPIGGLAVNGSPSAVTDPGGLVHVFARHGTDLAEYVDDGATPGQAWSSYDLTGYGMVSAGSDPSAFYYQSAGQLHAYVRSPGGDLIEYVDDNANGHLWSAYDLSAGPGGDGPIVGNPVALNYGPKVHIYGKTVNGDLVEYTNDGANGHLWNAYDLSYTPGGAGPIAGSPSAVNYGPTIHIYVEGSNGDLMEYVNDTLFGHIWNAYDLSAGTGAGAVTSKTTSITIGVRVHVYAKGPNGDLLEFVNDSAHGHLWSAYDLSAVTGSGPVTGNPSAISYGAAVHVYGRVGNNDLVEFVNDNHSGHIWSGYDLSAAAGAPAIDADPGPAVIGGQVHVYTAAA